MRIKGSGNIHIMNQGMGIRKLRILSRSIHAGILEVLHCFFEGNISPFEFLENFILLFIRHIHG